MLQGVLERLNPVFELPPTGPKLRLNEAPVPEEVPVHPDFRAVLTLSSVNG